VVRYFIEAKGIKPAEIAVFAAAGRLRRRGLRGRGEGASQVRGADGRDPEGRIQAQHPRHPGCRGHHRPPAARPSARWSRWRPTGPRPNSSRSSGTRGWIRSSPTSPSWGPRRWPRNSARSGQVLERLIAPRSSPPSTPPHHRAQVQGGAGKNFPGEKPDFVSLEGYIAATVFVEALKRAGPNPTTDSVIAALEGIQGLEIGIGTPVSFGPSEHQARTRSGHGAERGGPVPAPRSGLTALPALPGLRRGVAFGRPEDCWLFARAPASPFPAAATRGGGEARVADHVSRGGGDPAARPRRRSPAPS